MDLNPDFLDMIAALREERAEFLIVGAFALAAHGVPRATGDLDLWVRPHPENAERVWGALLAFGAPVESATPTVDDLSFEEAWPNRVTVEIEGLEIPCLGRDDLVRNKRATGRAKDLLDVELLRSGETSD